MINFKNPIIKNIAIGGAVVGYIGVCMIINSIIMKGTLAAIDSITNSIDDYIDKKVKENDNDIIIHSESTIE